MCIRDRALGAQHLAEAADDAHHVGRGDDATVIEIAVLHVFQQVLGANLVSTCLLYTSDAADERSSVDLGGRRIIKKTQTGAAVRLEEHRVNKIY